MFLYFLKAILFQGIKLRFVVIDRLGSDLEKHFKSGEAPFPLTTVLRVAVEVMEALEFIHAKHYVHNDIKAQNLMTGFTTDTADRIFLLDFGLASKYRYQHIFLHENIFLLQKPN